MPSQNAGPLTVELLGDRHVQTYLSYYNSSIIEIETRWNHSKQTNPTETMRRVTKERTSPMRAHVLHFPVDYDTCTVTAYNNCDHHPRKP